MKKIIGIVSFVCSILLLASCSQSREDRIIASFNDYVQKNFDDPSKMKEVVSVDSCDTISTKELKKVVLDLQKMADSLATVRKDIVDNVKNEIERKTKVRKYINETVFSAAFEQYQSSATEILNTMASDYNALVYKIGELSADKINRIKEAKDTTILQYHIKCRVEEKSELKLKTYYAITDLKEQQFRISNQPLQIEEAGLSKFVEDCTFLTDMYSKRIKYRKENLEAVMVLNSYFEKD